MKLTTTLATLAMVSLMSGNVFAGEAKPATTTTGQTGMTATETTGEKGMMGKMDHKSMMEMHTQCMDSKKDGKMCEKEMMSKCQENMPKGDCHKMMGQMKKETPKK